MAGKLTIERNRFRDEHGRHVILRGVNLGGDCKVPAAPNGHSYLPTDFADHREVSFVGRPAPLDEIDGHLARIAHWGFNCLRLLTTWEAVEHAGPGRHDEAYLDYFAEVCRRADTHGLHVFIDFHQDVWSRMSGGDGAPGWTFEAVGLDFTKFDAADAAHVMQHRYDASVGGLQTSYPLMSWGGNYRMPANGIMWTLFFGGQLLVPEFTIEGCNAQVYLQDHYLGSMRAIAERVAHLDHVIGFDTLNEPGSGWIGKPMSKREGLIRGPAWSPLDGLAVASGIRRTLPLLEGGEIAVNEGGTSVWLPGRSDPFRVAGAWDVVDGVPVARRDDFFSAVDGRPVDVERDGRLPFYHRVSDTIRAVRSDWLLFAEADPFGAFKGEGYPEGMPDRTVNASHWYDMTALVTKKFDPADHSNILTGQHFSSPDEIMDSYVEGLGTLAAIGGRLNGGSPTLVGECGIQYDLNGAEAFRRWAQGERSQDIWAAQTVALSLMYDALDRLLLSSTQWNYTVSNRNDPMIGDGWNQEDLSIWSNDQAEDNGIDAGGRAIAGFCRPYVRAAAGCIVQQAFDWQTSTFSFVIEPERAYLAPTEIFLPHRPEFNSWMICINDGPDHTFETGGLIKFIAYHQPLRVTCTLK